jgi:hypothetical protein
MNPERKYPISSGRFLWLLFGAMALSIASRPSPSVGQMFDVETGTAEELWECVLEKNRVWLLPEPGNLHYTLKGSMLTDKGDDGFISRVWIAGDRARWEFAFGDHFPAGKRAPIILAFDEGDVTTINSTNPQKVGTSRDADSIRRLRQGTAIDTLSHVLAENGLPENARIIERREVDGGHILVLACNVGNVQAEFGLGLYHVFLGASRGAVDEVRIHIKTPEFIPLKETSGFEEGTRIEYGSEWIEFDEMRAPSQIRQLSTLPDKTEWILEGRFRRIGDLWLLEKGTNYHGGKPVTEIVVSGAAVDPIPDDVFGEK